MPIYEYKCTECGHVSELLVNIGRNSDELKCSACGAITLEQLISASAFSFNNNELTSGERGSTCCGSNPSSKGCVPGSCCGSS